MYNAIRLPTVDDNVGINEDAMKCHLSLINPIDETTILKIDDDKTILKTNDGIVYPNEKIYIVAPIIEEKIEERDNYQPNCLILRCQNCIRMLLDIATRIYIILENIILFISSLIVTIDIFNITKCKINIVSRSKYNKYTIESSQSERLRRIVYWFYYNYKTPDEEEWQTTLLKFRLNNVPKFTIRLFINNEKSKYSIEIDQIDLKKEVDGVLIKGRRIIKLYEDIHNEIIDSVFISNGRRLLSTVEGMIPIGGLMVERFISDLKIDKIDKKIN